MPLSGIIIVFEHYDYKSTKRQRQAAIVFFGEKKLFRLASNIPQIWEMLEGRKFGWLSPLKTFNLVNC